jgi:hypothetical protein
MDMERTIKPYTVKPGDTLWKIALSHGFKSHKDLLEVPENKELFENTDRNEDRIFPGDKIFFPATSMAKFESKSNQVCVFRTPSKKGYIRLQLKDVLGEPLKHFKYEAKMYGEEFTGDHSSHDGHIEFQIPQKKNGNKVLPIGELSEEEKEKNLKGDDKLKQATVEIKLYPFEDDADYFELLRLHIDLDPIDEVAGALKELTNFCDYKGKIPDAAYEKSVQRINTPKYKEEDKEELKGQLKAITENRQNLTPLPSSMNFQPQYHAQLWEMLRFERLFQLAEESREQYEQEVEELKSNGQPYDASEILLRQAIMDCEYYQYCFTYWSAEYFSLKSVHTSLDSAMDTLLRGRSDDLVTQQLKPLQTKWRQAFSTETDLEKIENKHFPENEIEHVPQLRDVFSNYYSTEQINDKLTTTIVVPPMVSKVRFSYKDDPQTPIANSFVLYWRYDKADDSKIESGREDFYENARIMMPIGIGKTDEEGYLTQSLPLSINSENTFIDTSDGHFTMHAGLDPDEGLSHDYLQPLMAKFESSAGAQKYLNKITPLDEEWVEVFNKVNRKGWQNEYSSELLTNEAIFRRIRDSETYEEYVEKLLDLEYKNQYRYELMRTSVSNTYFNYYSSGSTDTWGFMVYPPDAGLLRTADLAQLGNEGRYAYKGTINSPNDQASYIELPCTLQEWERRLKVQTEKLKKGLDQYRVHSENHKNNIAALGRMDGLLNIYAQYPYEYDDEGKTDKEKEQEKELRNALKGRVNDLSSAISGIMQKPDPDKDQYLHNAMSDMDESSEAIMTLLQNSEFADQLDLYQKAHDKDEKTTSPYMEADQTWTSVYTVIADAIGLLAMCPKADASYTNLVQPAINKLVHSEVVIKSIMDGLGGLPDVEGAKNPDSLPVNKNGNTITETLADLAEVVSSTYTKQGDKKGVGSVLEKALENLMLDGADELRKDLNKWVNKTPGTPSVFIAMLEGYMTYITADAQKHGAVNGFHIKFLMMVSRGFGFISGKDGASMAGILGVLKTNDAIRLGTKIEVQKGIFKQVNVAISDIERDIDSVKSQIAKTDASYKKAKFSERLNLNSTLKNLNEKLADREKARDLTELKIDEMVEEQIKKQQKLVGDYDDSFTNPKKSRSDEFYEHADGQLARVYKTTLTVINIVAVVEDWAKVSRAWQKHELGQVDLDIVLAETMKTTCETAKTAASAILLVNRWAAADNAVFRGMQWLKSMDGVLESVANNAALGVTVITLYITISELNDNYGSSLISEDIGAYLNIAADALTIIGHVGVMLGLSMFAWVAAIGALFIVFKWGYDQYQSWVDDKYIKNGPVGFYFWGQFKLVRENSQRYSNDDKYVSESEDVVKAFKDLMIVANGMDIPDKSGTSLNTFKDADGWGHLSWRAAIILYRQWRDVKIDGRKLSETQLKTMISDLCKVPGMTLNTEKTGSDMRSTTTHYKLISPAGMLSFYCYLEDKVNSNPQGTWIFECSGLTYRAVMNLMEQGLYVPKGEAEEVLMHIKSDYVVKVSQNGQGSRHSTYHRRVIWDHEVFSKLPTN